MDEKQFMKSLTSFLMNWKRFNEHSGIGTKKGGPQIRRPPLRIGGLTDCSLNRIAPLIP
jgi:hypothetical protein